MRLPGKMTVYQGGTGQWSWAVHRITGIAVFLFLLAHIVDTALVGFGPEFYNRVVAVYHNPLIRLLEIGLAATVLFHALNGLRVIAIDMFPRLADRQRELFRFVVGLFMMLMGPVLYFMGKGFVDSL
ncbi:MAG: succinate dehydrogenase, cytochrome b556 subunit [Actinomycetota bacterium]